MSWVPVFLPIFQTSKDLKQFGQGANLENNSQDLSPWSQSELMLLSTCYFVS